MSDGRDFLPPDVKALVDGERHRYAIPGGARERLLSKLVAGAPALAHGAGPSAPPAGAAPVASGASGASTLLATTAAKVTVALAVLGVGAAVVLVQVRAAPRLHAPTVAPPSSPEAAVHAALPAPPLVTEAPPPVPPSSEVSPPRSAEPARGAVHSPSFVAPTHPREDTADESASLAEERRLLDAARASIVSGNPEAALPILESCAARFPGGPLNEERLALQIRALARTGRGDDARGMLETLRAAYPHSFVLPGAIDDVARIP